MKQPYRFMWLRQKFPFAVIRWLLIAMAGLLALGLTAPAAAQADTAQLRVGHFVFQAPAINLYMDGEAVTGQDGLPSVFGSMVLSQRYIDLAAGKHTFAGTEEGGSLNFAILGDQEFSLEAGHQYMLAVMGNMAAADMRFSLIDETAMLASNDISQSAVSIFVNNIYGVPAIDFYFDGKMFVENVAYGDYAIYQDPPDGKGSKITVHGQPDKVIFEYGDAVGSPAHVFAVFAFSGKFPGAIGEDIDVFYVGQYVGELTVTDAGVVTVGKPVPVKITGMGQRVRYTLTLDKDMTLDIVQTADDATTGADAYLRIYNTSNDAIYENDEVLEDDAGNDSGWLGLALKAGTYTLEAGTYADAGSSDFTLSVTAAH